MPDAVDEIELAILGEHLPYELDMLDASFALLHSPALAAHRAHPAVRNALVEAFWTHARNVIEFLTHPKGNDAAGGIVSARD